MTPNAEGKVYVLAACRYWLMSVDSFHHLLRRVELGEKLDAAAIGDMLDSNPILASLVSETERAGIPWRDGGVRNLDKPNPRMIAYYFAGTLK